MSFCMPPPATFSDRNNQALPLARGTRFGGANRDTGRALQLTAAAYRGLVSAEGISLQNASTSGQRAASTVIASRADSTWMRRTAARTSSETGPNRLSRTSRMPLCIASSVALCEFPFELLDQWRLNHALSPAEQFQYPRVIIPQPDQYLRYRQHVFSLAGLRLGVDPRSALPKHRFRRAVDVRKRHPRNHPDVPRRQQLLGGDRPQFDDPPGHLPLGPPLRAVQFVFACDLERPFRVRPKDDCKGLGQLPAVEVDACGIASDLLEKPLLGVIREFHYSEKRIQDTKDAFLA